MLIDVKKGIQIFEIVDSDYSMSRGAARSLQFDKSVIL